MSFVDADYWSVEENGAWKVVERIDIADATVNVADDLVYDGAEKAGIASVTYAGTELVADTDYTVEYADNIAAGDSLATAILTGIGLYKGTTSATFSIAKKPVTIMVADVSKVYNDTDPAFTGVVEGLVNANDLGEIAYSRTGSDEDVGTYDDVLTATYTANANYAVTVVPGDFAITPAPVTVTADDATKTAGNADPTFTATVAGLLDVSDSIAYSFAREEGEAVGTYAITPQGEQFQGNYEVTYVAGTLTITGAIAKDSEGVYYGSLREAIEGAPAGGTVMLLADDETSFAAGGIVIDKNIVIDGDGHAIKGISEDGSANVATPADIGSDTVHGFYVTAGDVTIRNVALTEFGDTDYLNKFGFVPVLTSTNYSGDLVLENVDIDQFNRQAICVFGGTLTVTGGTISANAEGMGIDSGFDYFQ